MAASPNITIFINPSGNAPGEYLVELREGEKSIAQVETRIERRALLEHEHAYSAHDYGMELYDAVFTGKVGREYQRLAGRAGTQTVVCVQLVISEFVPELHALPWERMFHVFGDVETPLATSAQTPFSRFLITGARDQPPVQDRPLRMLVAIASPQNLPQEKAIDVTAEITALADLVDELRGRVAATLLPGCSGLSAELRQRLEQADWQIIDGATSWGNIRRYLPGQHMLHILAHGQFKPGDSPGKGTAYLLLEHAGDQRVPPGSLLPVSDQEVVEGLAGIDPLPQLVFLAACESAKRPADGANPFVGLAPRLVQAGVPAVVAMQDAVPIDLARTLAADFYHRLFEHGQVDRALNEARSLVYQRNKFEWAIPVLFLRLRDGQLFAQRRATFALRAIFDGLLELYTRLFAGRDAQLAELESFLREGAAGFMLVTAPAGLGKTALMANLVNAHRDELAYHFFAPSEAESLREEVFLRNLLEQIGPWYGVKDPPAGQLVDLQARYDALLGQSPEGVHTVVLDGLDEVTWELSRYLKRELPPNLHVILTVHDVGQDPIADYKLPVAQVRRLPLDGLDREGVRAVLRQAGGHAPRFAEQEEQLDEVLRVAVYDEARPEIGADPFFVRLLAEDLASGVLKQVELAALPVGMQEYLKRWWEAIRPALGDPGKAEIDQAMTDLIGTLAAAFGPIGRADLQAIHPTTLVHQVFKRFFDELVSRVRKLLVVGSGETYSLLHPRLRGYLQQMIETRPYAERLLEYCTRWPQHHSHYALAYYARHLAAAADTDPTADDRLAALFADQAWMEARVADSGYLYDGYLSDLNIAWERSHAATRRQIDADQEPALLALCVRYALIRSSINSLAGGYDPALVARAVTTGVWPVERALSVSRLIPEPANRVDMLTALLSTQMLTASQRQRAEEEGLTAAQAIDNEESRARALAVLASQLAGEARNNTLREALAAVHAIYYESARAQMLSVLAPQLTGDLVREGLAAAQAIDDEGDRASALAALVPQLTGELVGKGLAATLAINDEGRRAEVLAALAPQLTGELVGKGLAATLAINDEGRRAEVLAALAPQLAGKARDNALRAELAAVQATEDEESCAYVLMALAPQLTGELAREGLAAAQTIENEKARVLALTVLALRLTGEAHDEAVRAALAATLAIEDEKSRAQTLGILASQLAGELVREGLAAALAIEDEKSRALVLSVLAAQLTGEMVGQGLAAALVINDQWWRAQILMALAPQLTGEARDNALRAGLTLVQAIKDEGRPGLGLALQDERRLARVLAALVPQLTGEIGPRASG